MTHKHSEQNKLKLYTTTITGSTVEISASELKDLKDSGPKSLEDKLRDKKKYFSQNANKVDERELGIRQYWSVDQVQTTPNATKSLEFPLVHSRVDVNEIFEPENIARTFKVRLSVQDRLGTEYGLHPTAIGVAFLAPCNLSKCAAIDLGVALAKTSLIERLAGHRPFNNKGSKIPSRCDQVSHRVIKSSADPVSSRAVFVVDKLVTYVEDFIESNPLAVSKNNSDDLKAALKYIQKLVKTNVPPRAISDAKQYLLQEDKFERSLAVNYKVPNSKSYKAKIDATEKDHSEDIIVHNEAGKDADEPIKLHQLQNVLDPDYSRIHRERLYLERIPNSLVVDRCDKFHKFRNKVIGLTPLYMPEAMIQLRHEEVFKPQLFADKGFMSALKESEVAKQELFPHLKIKLDDTAKLKDEFDKLIHYRVFSQTNAVIVNPGYTYFIPNHIYTLKDPVLIQINRDGENVEVVVIKEKIRCPMVYPDQVLQKSFELLLILRACHNMTNEPSIQMDSQNHKLHVKIAELVQTYARDYTMASVIDAIIDITGLMQPNGVNSREHPKYNPALGDAFLIDSKTKNYPINTMGTIIQAAKSDDKVLSALQKSVTNMDWQIILSNAPVGSNLTENHLLQYNWMGLVSVTPTTVARLKTVEKDRYTKSQLSKMPHYIPGEAMLDDPNSEQWLKICIHPFLMKTMDPETLKQKITETGSFETLVKVSLALLGRQQLLVKILNNRIKQEKLGFPNPISAEDAYNINLDHYWNLAIKRLVSISLKDSVKTAQMLVDMLNNSKVQPEKDSPLDNQISNLKDSLMVPNTSLPAVSKTKELTQSINESLADLVGCTGVQLQLPLPSNPLLRANYDHTTAAELISEVSGALAAAKAEIELVDDDSSENESSVTGSYTFKSESEADGEEEEEEDEYDSEDSNIAAT